MLGCVNIENFQLKIKILSLRSVWADLSKKLHNTGLVQSAVIDLLSLNSSGQDIVPQ